jgi:hypothetical protein
VLADEQSLADVGVRQTVPGEACDLGLLRGECIASLDTAFADPLAGGQQLPLGAGGERLDLHRTEQLERGAQLFPGVPAAALTP